MNFAIDLRCWIVYAVVTVKPNGDSRAPRSRATSVPTAASSPSSPEPTPRGLTIVSRDALAAPRPTALAGTSRDARRNCGRPRLRRPRPGGNRRHHERSHHARRPLDRRSRRDRQGRTLLDPAADGRSAAARSRRRRRRPLPPAPGRPDSSTGASASYAPVQTPEAPPYSVEGRIFIKQGKLKGYCSGTAINSPTRQLVLTAGHCVNSGPQIDGRTVKPAVASNYLEFVPAYSGGAAPFGAFVSRRSSIRALPQWIEQGNPDFDIGAFLTYPNAEGRNVADAVGGGATIVLGLSRKQTFKTFGYPGEKTHMEGCESPYVGDDPLTYPLPGPPTMAVKCRWAPGASGGGWLINEGFEVNGINTYLKIDDKSRTYGPYFTKETVGKLVRGY